MKFYCLIIGVSLVAAATLILWSRVRFISHAHKVKAKVITKVYRNKSTETRTSRAKVLKLGFDNPFSGPAEYICDTNLLTPFYKINDNLELAVSENKVLLRNWPYIILAPFVLAALGCTSIYVFFQL